VTDRIALSRKRESNRGNRRKVARLRQARSAPAQPDHGGLEYPAIEQFDGLGFRGSKIELAGDCLRIGEKPVAQLVIQQGSADQFRQMPARRGAGVGI